MMATITPRWLATTATQPWIPLTPTPPAGPANLRLTGATAQRWQGFGGCFNELGWEALRAVSAEQRHALLGELFAPAGSGGAGCRFTMGRVPIGASDYALEWYSHNEHEGDFGMEHFSIARDEKYLLPYIKTALAWQPELTLFASPWSPPTWMKHPKVYNHGTLIWKPEYLKAYALYLWKFVEAYRAAGIHLAQVHPQNEPVADQKFPSCLWTGPQMRDFIRDYLAPLFREKGAAPAIWVGTLNTDDYNGWLLPVLLDPAVREAIGGVALQWGGKHMIQRIAQAFPEVPLMQSENECGDGRNTFDYAQYIFGLLQHYLANGASSYIYWNMILPPGGKSTWGWQQNALLTIDPATGQVTRNPEFYLLQHFAHFIRPGAVRLVLAGPWASNAVAFRNPDGQTVLVLHNPLPEPCTLTLDAVGNFPLPPQSFNTIT